MSSYVDISLAKLIESRKETKSFNNEIMIVELNEEFERNPENANNGVTARLNAFSILLIRKGEMIINMNDIEYHLSADMLLDLTNLDVFKEISLSRGFKGYHVIIDLHFFDEILRDARPLTPDVYTFKRTNPIEKLTPLQSDILADIISRILRNIDRTDHLWHRRIILHEAKSLFMEIGNIIIQNFNKVKRVTRNSNNEMVFFRFNHFLREHHLERQSVSFYADKLCLSTDYFSKLIKSYSGKTVSEWINDALLREAKACLRNPNMTIQQIAYKLNFSDQSSFGKFFKKHTLLSPQKFRKQMDTPSSL